MKDRKLSHKLMSIVFNTPSLQARLTEILQGSKNREIIIDGEVYVVKLRGEVDEKTEA